MSNTLHFLLPGFIVGCVVLGDHPVAQDAAVPAQRREFQQAYAAAQAGVPAQDSPALRGYALYPYLQAERLRRALSADATAADASIEAFLMDHSAEPVAGELRRTWLISLAQRARWTQFLEHYRADGADTELHCQALQAQLALQQVAEVRAAVVALWTSAVRLPSPCTVPVTWARVQNVITTEMVEQRTVLALKNGDAMLARELLPAVPAPRAAPLKTWLQLIEQPQIAIDRLLADASIQIDDAALLDGWTRLARKDQDAALARYARLIDIRKLDQSKASPYALSLALALAWSRRPEALEYFARANSTDFNDMAWEWQARAALWTGDWQRTAQFITAMPEGLRGQARWRYWAARAAERLDDRPAAVAGYAQLMETEDNYYAGLAAARLGKRYTPHVQEFSLERARLDALEKRPGLQRAYELWQVDLKPQAGVEWAVEYRQLDAAEQAAAVHLAARWGWHDVAIAAAAQQRVFNDYALLYPRPYDREVNAAAKLAKLPRELIYGQLRQESLFRSDAVSTANARGLLQLLPATARSTAKRWRWPAPSTEQLFDPAVNVKLGAAHLRELLDRYGRVAVALAAYNAGPRAAERWLPVRPLNVDVWVENIPYNETRNYIQKIFWHSLVFEWLERDKAVDTRDWLTEISS